MPAASSGRPMRRSGTPAATISSPPSASARTPSSSTGTVPGTIAFTGDVIARQPVRELAGEHVHGGLARGVRVVLGRGNAHAVDRTDVDAPRAGSSASARRAAGA